MSRFLRWQGLAIFFAVVALIVAFVYFFAESIVKRGIEYGGGHYLGAEVNVEAVEINYNPVQIHVLGLQATDAKAPTTNVVSFDKASAGLDLWQYFYGKILIDELAIEKLAFASKRAKEGEVYIEVDAEAESEKGGLGDIFNTDDIELPDPKTLLDDANLATVKEAELLEVAYQEERKKLEQLKKDLPTKERLAEYEQQVKALTDVKVKSLEDIERIKADFDKIKKQFEADKALVEKAKSQLANSKKVLSERVTALKNAPEKDWQTIEQKYQLENLDTEDFAHMLFGEKAREYYQMAELFMEKVGPLMAGKSKEEIAAKEAKEGRYVHFDQENPQPDLLVNRARFSVVSPQGDFNIALDELTHQHWFRNKPTVFNVSSSNVLGQGNALLSGTFAVDQQTQVTSEGNWNFSGVAINDVTLQDSKSLAMAIDSGLVQGNGKFALNNGAIDASNSVKLSNAAFSGSGDNKVASILLDTLKGMDAIEVGAKVTGPVNSPSFDMTSGLDNLLSNAIQGQVNQQLAKFKGGVQGGLNDKLSGALSANQGNENDILAFDSLLGDTGASLDSLLSSDVTASAQKQLENKLKDKLKGKLGDLFN
mgnify:CR=1 FL=1